MLAKTHVDFTAELWVSDGHDYWSQLVDNYGLEIFQQRGGDLGERMLNAAKDALQRSSSVVIIGTDCPYLSPDYIHAAFAALQTSDAVLGPAEDGGYVLIGLKRALEAVFSAVNWGSETVLAQTQNNLRCLGLSWKALGVLSDIDRPDDVQRLLAIAKSSGASNGSATDGGAGITLVGIEACLASLASH